MTQLTFFDIEKPKPTGEQLRDKGIAKAVKHTEEVHDGWQERALAFFEDYLSRGCRGRRFSGEMVRLAAKGIVPEPPSLRTWGAVLLTAARRGWIKQVGFVRLNNPKCHRTPAALWEAML
jgi:hypothetical protein